MCVPVQEATQKKKHSASPGFHQTPASRSFSLSTCSLWICPCSFRFYLCETFFYLHHNFHSAHYSKEGLNPPKLLYFITCSCGILNIHK
uniref:Uncharacterized protein n=1 Tax=Sciurus vulgaris TaxID=55149 RepID=A0A8D2JNF3_SCIVU